MSERIAPYKKIDCIKGEGGILAVDLNSASTQSSAEMKMYICKTATGVPCPLDCPIRQIAEGRFPGQLSQMHQ